MDVSKVFVYGTLKQGQSSYNVSWQAGAHTVTPATLSGFQLFDIGPYPAVLEGDGVVYGQLLDYGLGINDALVILDRLEDFHGTGNPDNYYSRLLVDALVSNPRDGPEWHIPCWVYIYNRRLDIKKLLPEGV